MAEPAQLTIRREFPRPSAGDISAFEKAPTGWVVDAQGRRGALPHWIRPLSQTSFVGTALTVRTRPVDNLAPYAALKFAKPGDVLVVAVDGSETASVIGDILLGMAKNAGIVAAVTDGVVRDIEGINQRRHTRVREGFDAQLAVQGWAGRGRRADNARRRGDRIRRSPRRRHRRRRCRAARRDCHGRSRAEGDRGERGQDGSRRASGANYPAWLDDVLKSDRVRFVD